MRQNEEGEDKGREGHEDTSSVIPNREAIVGSRVTPTCVSVVSFRLCGRRLQKIQMKETERNLGRITLICREVSSPVMSRADSIPLM